MTSRVCAPFPTGAFRKTTAPVGKGRQRERATLGAQEEPQTRIFKTFIGAVAEKNHKTA